MDPSREPPRLLRIAAWLSALQGLGFVALAALGLLVVVGAVGVGVSETKDEEAALIVAGGVIGGFVLLLVLSLGILLLYASWRACRLSRAWILVLLALSMIGTMITPCYVPVFAITLVAATLALDIAPRSGGTA